jgi:hypothetical protein
MAGFSLRAPEAEIRPSVLAKKQKVHEVHEDEANGNGNEKANGNDKDNDNDNDNDNDKSTHSSSGWGRGILRDFKTTVGTHWRKELTNFNTKTIAVSLFLFIAVIAPCITFGAVYAKTTNNAIGASELLLSTAWCGIFYSLCSGMPLMINGATGPVLAFQAVLASLADKTLGVPFLTVRTRSR